MHRRAILAVAGVLLLAAGATPLVLRRPDAAAEGVKDPTDTRWICTAPPCGKDFSMTFAELGGFYDEHPGQHPPCPVCGTNATVRAAACGTCGRTVPKADREHAKPAPTCPHCGKPL